jgi:sulfonate transport system permease protein
MLSRWIGTSVNWLGLSVFALVLAAWEGAVRSGAIAFKFLPAPSAILAGAIERTRDGILLHDLLHDLLHTLLSIAMGWTLAMIVGIVVGLLLGFSPLARRYGLASIEVLRPMPGIALAPLGLLLFGFSLQTELVVMVLPTVWPVLVNTMGGIANRCRADFPAELLRDRTLSAAAGCAAVDRCRSADQPWSRACHGDRR